jgi:hypothetical protein
MDSQAQRDLVYALEVMLRRVIREELIKPIETGMPGSKELTQHEPN